MSRNNYNTILSQYTKQVWWELFYNLKADLVLGCHGNLLKYWVNLIVLFPFQSRGLSLWCVYGCGFCTWWSSSIQVGSCCDFKQLFFSKERSCCPNTNWYSVRLQWLQLSEEPRTTFATELQWILTLFNEKWAVTSLSHFLRSLKVADPPRAQKWLVHLVFFSFIAYTLQSSKRF